MQILKRFLEGLAETPAEAKLRERLAAIGDKQYDRIEEGYTTVSSHNHQRREIEEQAAERGLCISIVERFTRAVKAVLNG